jgi:hypothetical protein
MTRFRTTLLLAAAAALSLGAMPVLGAPATGARQCLTDQEIQSAIASGQIKSWPKIKMMARIPSDYQEVSDAKVCMIGGVPYYTVNLMSSRGDAKKIVLNAVDGSS